MFFVQLLPCFTRSTLEFPCFFLYRPTREALALHCLCDATSMLMMLVVVVIMINDNDGDDYGGDDSDGDVDGDYDDHNPVTMIICIQGRPIRRFLDLGSHLN